MKSYMLCLLFLLGLAMVRSDEFGEMNGNGDNTDQEDNEQMNEEMTENEASEQTVEQPAPVSSDTEKAKPAEKQTEKYIVEDEETKTSALSMLDNDEKQKALGYCHWGIAVWYKPGFRIRCNCLICTCLRGGKFSCRYNFAYCPYYYCGGSIYNPQTQLCCCGKVYTKRRVFSCCGYFYYNTRTSKCCNYYTVKPRKVNCPRYQIGPIKG